MLAFIIKASLQCIDAGIDFGIGNKYGKNKGGIYIHYYKYIYVVVLYIKKMQMVILLEPKKVPRCQTLGSKMLFSCGWRIIRHL